MKQKSFSISNMVEMNYPIPIRNRKTNSNHDLKSKPDKTILLKKKTANLDEAETKFKIRKCSAKRSTSKLEAIKEIEIYENPTSCLTGNLGSIEECRKAFDFIIQKHQKYGSVLKKIKEVYENELMPQQKSKTLSITPIVSPSNIRQARIKKQEIPDLKLQNLSPTEFHSEFMSNFSNFSESWRKLIIK